MYTVLITLTLAGSDVGPFNLYSDADGYVTPFATGVSRTDLLAGYTSTVVPDGSTNILARSTGVCSRDLYMPISGAPTTTTTTSSTTSSTTTSTTSTTSTTTTAAPTCYQGRVSLAGTYNYVLCDGTPGSAYFNNDDPTPCYRSFDGPVSIPAECIS